jgi:hypothetical protein
MTFSPSFSITGKHIMICNESGRFFISQVENPVFKNAIAQLYDWVLDNHADEERAYDWVCDQCDILTFVADEYAWNMYYSVFQSASKLITSPC